MKRVKCTQGLRRFLNGSSSGQNKGVRKELLEVITVRTWKEYVEESVLIVFSVVLALLLTTLFQKLHENKQTREVLHELREELITNKKSEEIQLTYHLQVLKNIDSALADPAGVARLEARFRLLPMAARACRVDIAFVRLFAFMRLWTCHAGSRGSASLPWG
jgi:hypothetical protein